MPQVEPGACETETISTSIQKPEKPTIALRYILISLMSKSHRVALTSWKQLTPLN